MGLGLGFIIGLNLLWRRRWWLILRFLRFILGFGGWRWLVLRLGRLHRLIFRWWWRGLLILWW